MPEKFKGIYSLDVLEHIELADEEKFMASIAASNTDDGVLIIGTPNRTASPYASEGSKIGHVNLKTHESLKETVARHYRHVFMFGMNDEVVQKGVLRFCNADSQTSTVSTPIDTIGLSG